VGALLHNLGQKAEYRGKSMTKRTRRNHSGSFKAKMALAALRSDKPLTEIAQHYEVYPNQVTEWKRQLLERAADVFEGGAVRSRPTTNRTSRPSGRTVYNGGN
jgi:transposase-like protein